tara:strand:- start:577 stop:1029 length:453 start_codon:yes stop_codon:yes gene_type:complete
MKKLIYCFLLFVTLGCSKDDDSGSSSSETFLQKYDGIGFEENDVQYPSYMYFYDSNIFLKNPVYYDFDGYDCQEITEGVSETILGNITVKIITNNSTTLKLESTFLGISTTSEMSVNSSGEILSVTNDFAGEKETITYTKTDIPYSQICD